MNPKEYLTICYYSKINFPSGLNQMILGNDGEPPIVKDAKLVFKIDSIYSGKSLYTNDRVGILKCQSIYEIPVNDIKDKKELYSIFIDADANLFAHLNDFERNNNTLETKAPNPQPIEYYQSQIDYIFQYILFR